MFGRFSHIALRIFIHIHPYSQSWMAALAFYSLTSLHGLVCRPSVSFPTPPPNLAGCNSLTCIPASSLLFSNLCFSYCARLTFPELSTDQVFPCSKHSTAPCYPRQTQGYLLSGFKVCSFSKQLFSLPTRSVF